jgi:hypothetical protein
VDIGASWGLFSYHLAGLVGGDGTADSAASGLRRSPSRRCGWTTKSAAGTFIDGAALRPIGEFDLEKHQLSSLAQQVFTPFSMPEGYVHNFCAVASPDILAGIPGFTA